MSLGKLEIFSNDDENLPKMRGRLVVNHGKLDRFLTSGAEHRIGVLNPVERQMLTQIYEGQEDGKPGCRLVGNELLRELLNEHGSIAGIAFEHLGSLARPVRALLFDKNPKNNWALGWHQDRTIAVKEKKVVAGFGPWTKKSGIHHLEPPTDIMSRMITLRVHLDDCDRDNAALLVAPGSHLEGRFPVEAVTETVERLGTFICEARAGDVWIYSSLILHASNAAKAPTHRRVLHIDYAANELSGGLEWLGI
jgi:hypothetical protein